MTLAQELMYVSEIGGWRRPVERQENKNTRYNRLHRDELLKKKREKRMAARK